MMLMKIVYVVEWDSLAGGGFTAVSNLIETILKLKFPIEIHIVSFGKVSKTVSQNGYTLHLVQNICFPSSKYWYSYKLIKDKILEIDPDLIHLHFTYPPYSYISTLPIPVIITAHSLSFIKTKGIHSKRSYVNLSFLIDPYFEKIALKNADCVIAVSDWVKQNIDNIIGCNTKTVYIPNGINYEKYEPLPQKQNIKNPSILTVGRLVKLKGMDLLIKALPNIKELIPNIHLYIAGEGVQCEKLKSLAVRLNVQENITFLGFVSEDKIIKMLSSVDIFVTSSRSETFGIVVLEALAAGTPVIASNVGGIPQLLNNGEYGLLVEPENPEDLSSAVIKLIKDPVLMGELSKKGRLRAQEYSWNEITKKTIELYKLHI
ncbi:glycosyltransferase family 4 protein [Methanosarcina mazei]|nr:glycosyltransferase family 4 protein [Methanosarcina mazei]